MEIMNENVNVEATATEKPAKKSKKGLIGVIIGVAAGAVALTAMIVKSATKKNDGSDEVIECEDYTEADEEDSE